MLRSITLLLFGLILTSGVWSQEMRFTGTVQDTVNDKPVQYAVVMAVRLSDAKLMGFTRTDSEGKFDLSGVPMDTLEIVITHPKFEDKNYYIIGNEGNLEIEIPNIILSKDAIDLDEVVVFANKEPIYFKGDTLVYVADSFALKEFAVVEDLLKNLPGIEVQEDGSISSGGREVTKVLVDGDEFFGSDPTIATRNLRADGVETIEIYETEDEASGGNSEEKIQVMDVRLKDDAKRGYFGKVSAFGGANPELLTNEPGGSAFYEGEFLANYFDSNMKISVFGLGANTPNTGFSNRDASRFGLTNEMSTGWRGRFIGGREKEQGFPESYKGGFYFSNKIGEKTKIGVNYTYNRSALLKQEETTSEFFLQDTSYTTNESSRNNTDQTSHTINFNVEQQLDSLTSLDIKSNLTLREEFDENENSTSFFDTESVLRNATSVQNVSTAQGLEGNINAKLTRKFMKRNRKLEVEYQFGYSENDRENFMNSIIQVAPEPSDNDIDFNQRRDIRNKTNGHRALIEYTEPLGDHFKINLQYKLDYFTGLQSNLTRDFEGGGYAEDIVPEFSNDFNNERIENRAGAAVIYTSAKQTINAGSRFRQVLIDNTNNFNGDVISQDVKNILPYLEYVYKFSNSHRLRFSYTASSDQPSLGQLQPVNDNRNPNNIMIGNPDLVPNYVHSFNAFYNKWNALQQNYVWATAFATLTNDAFSNSILYLPDGRTISQSINVDGNLVAGVFAGGGLPLFNKFLRLDPNANVLYNKFNSEIQTFQGNDIVSQMNTTENMRYTGGLGVSVRNDSIEVSVGVDFSYSDPSSSLSVGANQPFTTQTYKAEVFFELPWRMFIESDIRYIRNTRRAEGFNIDPVIWNATLNKRFTKTGNLVVSIKAYDMLNQNIGIDRQILNNVIIDNRTQVIARYFMAGLTWRFNHTKTKEDDGRHGWF